MSNKAKTNLEAARKACQLACQKAQAAYFAASEAADAANRAQTLTHNVMAIEEAETKSVRAAFAARTAMEAMAKAFERIAALKSTALKI